MCSPAKSFFLRSEPAANLASAPIKVTRTAEVEPAEEKLPAKKGCFGCAGLLLAALMLGVSGVAYALGP